MKKFSIILLALLPALTGWSQDTVDSFIQEGYYYNNLPNLKEFNAIAGACIWGDTCGIICKRLITEPKQQLKIYGVAASMMTKLDRWYLSPDADSAEQADFRQMVFESFQDTSLVNAYEYVGIYLRSGDSLAVQQQKRIHRMYDTAAYYVRPDPSVFDVFRNPNFAFPMYEKYFDSTITVTDTFYVGSTQRSQEGGSWGTWRHVGLYVVTYAGTAYNRDCIVAKYCYPAEGSVYWTLNSEFGEYGELHEDYYMMLFPILTPQGASGDTSGVGGDTLAVTQADMVARYISVQPNPATEQARVLSSFGLSHIEAYNAGGQKVYEAPASGLEAVIDVAPWPRGTYLLRITTPLGTVTKKLLVQ